MRPKVVFCNVLSTVKIFSLHLFKLCSVFDVMDIYISSTGRLHSVTDSFKLFCIISLKIILLIQWISSVLNFWANGFSCYTLTSFIPTLAILMKEWHVLEEALSFNSVGTYSDSGMEEPEECEICLEQTLKTRENVNAGWEDTRTLFHELKWGC